MVFLRQSLAIEEEEPNENEGNISPTPTLPLMSSEESLDNEEYFEIKSNVFSKQNWKFKIQTKRLALLHF